MAALARFFPGVAWTGTVAAGGMGPGTAEMTAVGRPSHRFIQDGRWIVVTGSQEQSMFVGTFVLTWQLHLVAGWDPSHGDYRATIADNYGHAVLMSGRIDRDRLVFETVDDAGAVRLRMTLAKALGVFVIRNGRVAWRPAIDVNRVILGAQIVAVAVVLTIRAIVKSRRGTACGATPV
jgi:hypothetical protein